MLLNAEHGLSIDCGSCLGTLTLVIEESLVHFGRELWVRPSTQRRLIQGIGFLRFLPL
jgi:hypothetical protein